MDERVRVEVNDGVARVTLTRADKHNGMDLLMLDAAEPKLGCHT